MNVLENLKKVLESDAGLLIEDMSEPTVKKVVDNRLSLIKQNINLVVNKDDNFYDELIKLLAKYMKKNINLK